MCAEAFVASEDGRASGIPKRTLLVVLYIFILHVAYFFTYSCLHTIQYILSFLLECTAYAHLSVYHGSPWYVWPLGFGCIDFAGTASPYTVLLHGSAVGINAGLFGGS